MTFKACLIAAALSLHSAAAPASTFENMEGIYKIISCRNEGGSPSREDIKLCEYSQLTVHPSSYATAIYFSQSANGYEYVRSFGVPKNMANLPNGKYIERGDTYASYTNDYRGSGEVFIFRKTSNDTYHFSMHRRSDTFGTFDVFEIELQKIANRSKPLPHPPPVDDEESPCGEPEYD